MTTSKMRWDPQLKTWVAGPQYYKNETPFRKIDEEKNLAAGDAFAGGVILGLSAIGVVWTIIMGLAFAIH